MMKTKLTFLKSLAFVLITGFIFTSCSKDDAPEDLIVGTWAVENATLTTMVGDMSLDQYFADVLGLSAAEALQYTALFNMAMQQGFTGTIQINSDNTYVATLGGEADNGTWSISDDNTMLTIDSSTSDPMTLEILELTSSTLKIGMMETMSEDLNEDDVPEVISVNVELTFKKQ